MISIQGIIFCILNNFYYIREMKLFRFIGKMIPKTKRGIRNAHILILVPFFSVPLWLFFLQPSEGTSMLIFFGSMFLFSLLYSVLVHEHREFNNQQESYRRKKENKNVIFYKFAKDGKWFNEYIGNMEGRDKWNKIRSYVPFWEKGGPTDEWEKREEREKRLKKLLKK